jgi:molybdate transport system substrate-binding protein
MPIGRRWLLAATAAAVLLHPGLAVAQTTITVFAAASLKNALDEANAAFIKQTGIKAVVSYAATSALVKQIEAGAPADVFLSADLRWMDYAAERKLIAPDTRINLLGNALVLIAPKDSKIDKVAIGQGFGIAALAGPGRIALANVQSVPAGRYAKAALQSLGAWAAAEKKLAMAENVRAALAFVARGETQVGIVYATDAKAEPNVKVIGTFPDGSHPPIVYPVAATAGTTKPEAMRYLSFLRSREAKAVFERHGFSFLARPSS